MEEIDGCFTKIKFEESITEVNDIIEDLVRIHEKKNDIYSKMYDIGNVMTDFKLKNKFLVKYNKDCEEMIESLNDTNADNEDGKQQKNTKIFDTLEIYQNENEWLDNESVQLKVHCKNAFAHWSRTTIGRMTPAPSDMMNKEFIALGAFVPTKLLGWFDTIINSLCDHKDHKSKADKSTAYDFSRSRVPGSDSEFVTTNLPAIHGEEIKFLHGSIDAKVGKFFLLKI